MSLARPDDVALVPAWLELDGPPEDPWRAVGAAVSGRSSGEVVEHAVVCSVCRSRACARLDLLSAGPPAGAASVVGRGPTHAPPWRSTSSSSWVRCGRGPSAAPCWPPLARGWSRSSRPTVPTAPAAGRASFFDLLNAGKQSVALDLSTGAGRRGARSTARAGGRGDRGVEASGPRAPRGRRPCGGLGRRALGLAFDHRPRPNAGRQRDWVAFGDDAAVAGGLVAEDERGPVFCADAVADPICGGGRGGCGAGGARTRVADGSSMSRSRR